MTRLRNAGIVWIVFVLAGSLASSSELAAQTKNPTPSATPKAAAPATTSKAPATPATQASKQVKLKPMDINSSSEEDLVLIGIDRAVAKKIVLARPFRTKLELVSKQLLTREQYDKIKDSLVATQPPKK